MMWQWPIASLIPAAADRPTELLELGPTGAAGPVDQNVRERAAPPSNAESPPPPWAGPVQSTLHVLTPHTSYSKRYWTKTGASVQGGL